MWNFCSFFTSEAQTSAMPPPPPPHQASVFPWAAHSRSLRQVRLLLLACSRVKKRVTRLLCRAGLRKVVNMYAVTVLGCTFLLGCVWSRHLGWFSKFYSIQLPLKTACIPWPAWARFPSAARGGRSGSGDGEKVGVALGSSGMHPSSHFCGPSSAPTDGGEDDDISFADATESAFRVFQRRVERTHMAPLLHALDELESLGKRLQICVSLHAADATDTSSIGSNNITRNIDGGCDDVAKAKERQMMVAMEDEEDNLRERIHQHAVKADELLTQLIVHLDMAPVGESIALRQQRKASITATSVLADRIARWMYMPPRSRDYNHEDQRHQQQP